MRLLSVVTLGWVSCTPPSMQPDPDPGPEQPTEPGPALGYDDVGGIVIDVGDGSEPAQIQAVFLDESSRYANLGACAVDLELPCIRQFPPEPDRSVALNPATDTFDRSAALSRFVGFEIVVGGYAVPFQEEDGFGFYSRTLDGLTVPEVIGVTGHGEWDDFDVATALTRSPTMDLLSPSPASQLALATAEVLPLEWVPVDDGVVTLHVISSVQEEIYLLEDDGLLEFPLDDIVFAGPVEEVRIELRRWDRAEIEVGDHILDIASTSHQAFEVELSEVGNRDVLRAADTCDGAQTSLPVSTGTYWGRLDWYEADAAPECVPGGCAFGYDGVHKLEVPPKHRLRVDYNVLADSASMYLLDCDGDGTCAAGFDDSSVPDGSEFFTVTNLGDSLERYYLALDSAGGATCDASAGPVASAYTLDVVLDPLVAPQLYDVCADAEAAPVLLPGEYYNDVVSFDATLDPGVGGCTGSAQPGPDTMFPIELGPGQTVNLLVDMPGGDPALYLLYDCEETFSCPVGSDRSSGQDEALVYTNASASTERLYVVVDSKTELLPFFLNR